MPSWSAIRNTTVSNPVDSLAVQYSGFANDGKNSKEEREAAMLLSVAEGYIRDGEDEEALTAAQDALVHYRAAKDAHGTADAVRVIIQCYAAQGRLEEAMSLAKDERSTFKKGGHKAEEAKMLLSLSEACGKQHKLLDEAVGLSRDALSLFRDSRNEKMEAMTWLNIARLLSSKKGDSKDEAMKEAQQAVDDALAIFQRLGDKTGEAGALHHASAVKQACGNFSEAIALAEDCVDMLQDLDRKKAEASELIHIANLYLEASKPMKALPYAEDALQMIQESGGSKKREVAALDAVVKSYLAKGRTTKAVQVAVKGLHRFQNSGETKAEAETQRIVYSAYIANGDKQKATLTLQKALESAADAGEKEIESQLLVEACDMHLESGANDKAVETASRALELAQDAKDSGAIDSSLKRLVRAYIALDDVKMAIDSAKEVREQMETMENTKGEACACLVMAEAHCAAKNFDLAAAAAKAASEIAYQTEDEPLEGASLDMLTIIYLESGKFEKASRAAEQARRIWHGLENAPKECNALSQTAMAFVNQAYKKQASGKSSSAAAAFFEKTKKAALECLTLAAELPASENGALYAGNAYTVFSQQHIAQGEIEPSLNAANEAVSQYQTAGDTRGEGYATVLVAQAMAELKKWEMAQKKANNALKLLKKVKDESGQEFAETLLAKIEKNMPKPEPVFAPQGMGWGAPGGGPKAWNVQSQQMSMQMQEMPADAGGGAVMRKREGGAALDMANITEEVVMGKIKEVALAIIGEDDVEVDTPLMEAGVTSSTAVILKDELAQEIPGVKLPPTLIFDYPSVSAIAEFIMEKVGK